MKKISQIEQSVAMVYRAGATRRPHALYERALLSSRRAWAVTIRNTRDAQQPCLPARRPGPAEGGGGPVPARRWRSARSPRGRAIPNRPHAPATCANLAAQHRPAEAEPFCLRALGVWEKVYVGGHPELGSMALELGKLRAAQGDHAGAEPYYARARSIFEPSVGKRQPGGGHGAGGPGRVPAGAGPGRRGDAAAEAGGGDPRGR